MVTKDDLQAFIDRLEGGTVESREIEPGLWVIRTTQGAEVVAQYNPPVVVLRVP